MTVRTLLVNGFFCLYLLFSSLFSQTAPLEGLRRNTPAVHALVNARIVTAPGKMIEKGTLVFRNSIIEAVGSNIRIPADADVRDVNGLTLYPGFIEPYSEYGIVKPKPPAPVGRREEGPQPFPPPDRRAPLYWNDAVHPERHAVEGFLPNKETSEKLRAMGFTITQTNSLDGIFRGTSTIVNLGDGPVNEIVIRPAASQFLSFSKGTSKQDYPGSLMGSIALIRQAILDARWYAEAKQAYEKSSDQKRPEDDLSLAALNRALENKRPFFFEVSSELDLLRAAKIAQEFSLLVIIRGSGYEYRRLDAVRQAGYPIILPVAFPDPPTVSSVEEEVDVSLADLKHWDLAPENPKRVSEAGISFAFTTHGLKDPGKFLDKVREAVGRGLKPDAALAALTSTPAKFLGIDQQFGTLEPGKQADFILTDGDLFVEKTKIRETWIDGIRYEVKPVPEVEVRGTWSMNWRIPPDETGVLEITGEPESLQGTVSWKNKSVKTSTLTLFAKKLAMTLDGDTLGYPGVVRMTGSVEGTKISGTGQLADGKNFIWNAAQTKTFVIPPDTVKSRIPMTSSFEVLYPEVGFGRKKVPEQPDLVFVKGATLWTSGPKGKIENADLIVRKGKITEVGPDLKAPAGAVVIEGKGKHVTPGIIDEHSHIAIENGVNEGTQAISAEVRIGDVLDSDDINIYRQLAGGVTVSHLLHGSANPIGGQAQLIRMRWGELPENLKFKEAPPTIKFALGENVKQSNWGDLYTVRYPQTRMGVEEIIRDEFQAAKDYRKAWADYNVKKKSNLNLIPPRKDLELETILEILDGKRFIHCHSYVQSEILMLIRVAEDMGFKVQTFTHILEGYKVADEMAKHGSGGGSFSDWWDYKFEVYDAIPYNGALMWSQGVVTSFNSDDAEMARRLNQEAGKAIKYGNVPEEEALKFVTINPAKQLKIEQYVGSLEPGKDADFVIWNGHPLSAYSKPLQTWVEGRKYFDIDEDLKLREEIKNQRAVLVQKILSVKKDVKSEPKTDSKQMRKPRPNYTCDDVFDYMKGGRDE